MTATDTEHRLSRLEEAFFFQDRLLTELNAALTQQQRQLDAMERSVAKLQEDLADLRTLLEAGGGPTNAPPPHYL